MDAPHVTDWRWTASSSPDTIETTTENTNNAVEASA
jgi:hypothetical protein